MGKDCGVAVARLQGHSWTPTPLKGSRVNVGTTSVGPCQQGGEDLSPVDAGGVGRRTRSSPGTGKPCTWRRGPVCSRLQCQTRRTLVNTGASWLGPIEAESRVLAMQTKLNRWHSDGMSTWRAGCGESRTSGSEGGPEKPIARKTTGRSGPTPTRTCRPGRGSSTWLSCWMCSAARSWGEPWLIWSYPVYAKLRIDGVTPVNPPIPRRSETR